MDYIESLAHELGKDWDWTMEEIESVKYVLASCAMAATFDLSIRQEAEEICRDSAEKEDAA